MSEVSVEVVEITDLGAQARGNRVFGVKIGDDTHLSFETSPDHYDPAVTFFLIGVMEGLRYAGQDAVLILPDRHRLTAENSGVISFEDVGVGSPPLTFQDWSAALAHVMATTG